MKTAEVIKHFEGIPGLARALGITRHAIYQWGDTVPEARQFEIEVKSGGVFKAARPPATGPDSG